ncbi:MAG: hypothetical protein HYU56_01270 [Candidatus Aenigmarchaeota archaeon]|nr:hypothetical protein [Candidatus Aenigmarchaeota archaeon]
MEFFKRLFSQKARLTTTAKEEKRDFSEYTQHVLSGPSFPGRDEKKGYAPDDPYMR